MRACDHSAVNFDDVLISDKILADRNATRMAIAGGSSLMTSSLLRSFLTRSSFMGSLIRSSLMSSSLIRSSLTAENVSFEKSSPLPR